MESTFSGVVVHPRVLEILDRHGHSPQAVVRAVRDPLDTFPGSNGRSTVFVGPTVAAIVADDTGEVVAVSTASRAREVRRQPRPGAVPRARGGGCGSRFPSSVAELLDRARRAGLTVPAPDGGHVQVRRPGVSVSVTVPTTPSDRRSIPNTVLTIRRVLGVDLRTVR